MSINYKTNFSANNVTKEPVNAEFECLLPDVVTNELVKIFKTLDIHNNLVVSRLKFIEILKSDSFLSQYMDTVAVTHLPSNQNFTFLNIINIIELEYMMYDTRGDGKSVENFSQRQMLSYFLKFNSAHLEILNQFEKFMNSNQNSLPETIIEKESKLDIQEMDLILLQDIFDTLPRAEGKFSVSKDEFVETCLTDPQLAEILHHPARRLFMGEIETIQSFLHRLSDDAPDIIMWELIIDYLKPNPGVDKMSENAILGYKPVYIQTQKDDKGDDAKEKKIEQIPLIVKRVGVTTKKLEALKKYFEEAQKEMTISPEEQNLMYEKIRQKQKAKREITIPKPPQLTDTSSKSSIRKKKVQEMVTAKIKDEEYHMTYKIPIQEPPENLKMPLTDVTSKSSKQKENNSKDLKKTAPPSFYERDEKKYKEKITKKLEPPKIEQFKVREKPEWYTNLQSTQEQTKQKEEEQKKKKDERKKEMLAKSKLPTRMEDAKKKDPDKQEKLKKIEQDLYGECKFQPAIKKEVVDFQKMHSEFSKKLEEVKKKKPTTSPMEFNITKNANQKNSSKIEQESVASSKKDEDPEAKKKREEEKKKKLNDFLQRNMKEEDVKKIKERQMQNKKNDPNKIQDTEEKIENNEEPIENKDEQNGAEPGSENQNMFEIVDDDVGTQSMNPTKKAVIQQSEPAEKPKKGSLEKPNIEADDAVALYGYEKKAPRDLEELKNYKTKKMQDIEGKKKKESEAKMKRDEDEKKFWAAKTQRIEAMKEEAQEKFKQHAPQIIRRDHSDAVNAKKEKEKEMKNQIEDIKKTVSAKPLLIEHNPMRSKNLDRYKCLMAAQQNEPQKEHEETFDDMNFSDGSEKDQDNYVDDKKLSNEASETS